MPRKRRRGRPSLWDPLRKDDDLRLLRDALILAEGKPIRPYALTREALQQYIARLRKWRADYRIKGDVRNHEVRLGNKLKKLLSLIDEVLSEDGLPNTEEDKRQEALKFVRYLMEPRDRWGLTREERAREEAKRQRPLKLALKEIEKAGWPVATLAEDRDRALSRNHRGMILRPSRHPAD